MDDFYALGKWQEWLKSFKEGEAQEKPLPEENLSSIRATISKLAKKGYYFKTITSRDILWVKRLDFGEWMDQSRRKL